MIIHFGAKVPALPRYVPLSPGMMPSFGVDQNYVTAFTSRSSGLAAW